MDNGSLMTTTRYQAGDLVSDSALKAMASHAQMLSKSTLVPEEFRHNPANCMLAIQMAAQFGDPLLTVMQAMYVVRGRMGWSAEYYLSRLMRSGAIKGTVVYRVHGKTLDELKVSAVVKDAESGEEVGSTVSFKLATAEGWTKNPKYKSDPVGMLKKRAVTLLVRNHYPHVMGGGHSIEELEDVAYAQRPNPGGRLSLLNQRAHAEPRTVEVDDDQAEVAGEDETTDPAPSEPDLERSEASESGSGDWDEGASAPDQEELTF